MPDPRNRPDDRPNTTSLPLIEQLQALEGEEMPADQDAVLSPEEIEQKPEMTDTELYLGELETGVDAGRGDRPGDVESLEGLADRDLRDGETDDPYVASDEGLTYVAPSDPPFVVSDDRQGIDIAAGTGASSLEEPYDEDHAGELLSVESDLTARIREALENDAATSGLADRIRIATIGGTVVLRGTVDTLDDGDALVEVVSRVSGVDEVRDETDFPGL
jgi:hypothetical protein